VCVGQRVDHLAQNADGLVHRQLALARQFDPERLAGNERHDVIQEVAVGAGSEKRNDVGMLQAGGELNLALEPFHVDRRPHLGRQELDDDLAAEADFLGEEHPTHAAAAQLLQDAVLVTDRVP
jgi:hypothetical protein